MSKDFEVKDRQIIVGDTYFGKDNLNKYLSKYKLKRTDYSDEEIAKLIDAVAFTLDNQSAADDKKIIAEMLESSDCDSETEMLSKYLYNHLCKYSPLSEFLKKINLDGDTFQDEIKFALDEWVKEQGGLFLLR